MSVASVLEQYPAGIVQSCLHPRSGYAAKVEYFSLHTLQEWFDGQLAFYQGLSAYKPPRLKAEPEMTDEQRESMRAKVGPVMRDLANLLKGERAAEDTERKAKGAEIQDQANETLRARMTSEKAS